MNVVTLGKRSSANCVVYSQVVPTESTQIVYSQSGQPAFFICVLIVHTTYTLLLWIRIANVPASNNGVPPHRVEVPVGRVDANGVHPSTVQLLFYVSDHKRHGDLLPTRTMASWASPAIALCSSDSLTHLLCLVKVARGEREMSSKILDEPQPQGALNGANSSFATRSQY